jgi:hypothetical protein
MNYRPHAVIQYVRNKKGRPTGVIVAIKSDQGFNVGYSLCNKKDRFDREMALKIAFGRAELHNQIPAEVPREICRIIPDFIARCKKYYRTDHEPSFVDYLVGTGR